MLIHNTEIVNSEINPKMPDFDISAQNVESTYSVFYSTGHLGLLTQFVTTYFPK